MINPGLSVNLTNWHSERLRVRYADTDRMGVVYHANYFIYFEACRSELIRSLWKPYSELEKEGYLLLVIDAGCRYRQAAEYDDILFVYATISKFTDVRIRFEYRIIRDSDQALIVEGYTEHCFADKKGKPCRMPPELKEILTEKYQNDA